MKHKREHRRVGKMIISDHALMRYLERVCRLDIDAIRRSILPPSAEKGLPTGSYPCKGYTVKVRDRVVTTIFAN